MVEYAYFSRQPTMVRAFLALAGGAALLIGLYGRFKGIGTWPLGVDEYYISRSIDNVLRVGLPRFACGGYYTRGLLYQYLVAGLRLSGLRPESAGRMLAGVCSLAVLPPAYMLAKRISGPVAGWVTVVILCISVWEIEMARFARMYAPFQAVFTWYLVFYLRYCVDRDGTALRWLIALSILGVLTWEGGILLGIANILAVVLTHENGRLRAVDWRRLFGVLALLPLLLLATRDLRGFAVAPAAEAGDAGAESHVPLISDWLAPLIQHPGGACILLLPLGFAVASFPWIWSYRRRWPVAVGLGMAIASAAAHLFAVSGGVLALMILSGLIGAPEFLSKGARYFDLAIVGFLVSWLAFDHWAAGEIASAAGESAASGALMVIRDLFGFPDIFDEIIRPWGRTLPILSLGLALAVAFWCWMVLTARTRSAEPIGALLCLITLLILAVGATSTERIETRYTFFLYPLFIVLGVTAIMRALQRQHMLKHVPVVVAAAMPLLCFSATEDFQPRHIARIDSADVNFRVGVSAVLAAHYYPRNDMRGVGRWFAAHVSSGDVVITGIPSLAQYYGGFDYFYLDEEDDRYEAYVCPDAKMERWTNHPVLYGENALRSVVASGRRVFVNVYPYAEERLRAHAQAEGWSVTTVWTEASGQESVLLIAMNVRAAGGDQRLQPL